MARFPRKPTSSVLVALIVLLGLLPTTMRGQDATPAPSAVSPGDKALRIYTGSFPETLDPQMSDWWYQIAGLRLHRPPARPLARLFDAADGGPDRP